MDPIFSWISFEVIYPKKFINPFYECVTSNGEKVSSEFSELQIASGICLSPLSTYLCDKNKLFQSHIFITSKGPLLAIACDDNIKLEYNNTYIPNC